MKFSMTTKLAAASGLTALLIGGLVPQVAQADPIASGSKSLYGQLSGVGSDTTQDVMNGLSIAIGRVSTNGDWKLASYDATGAGTMQTKLGGNVAIGRPNGSGDGLKALNVAIGAATSNTGTQFATPNNLSTWAASGVNSVIGQIQYSRSSSGPTTVSDGVVAYVPYAKDAVGYAVSSNSVIPALSVGDSTDAADSDGVTPSTLWAIYNCSATRIITKTGQTAKLVNNSYTAGAGETSTRIRAYIPQSSSGTAKYWQGASGAKFVNPTAANLYNCVERKKFVTGDAGDVSGGNNTFTSGADYTGIDVQEHSGAVLLNDPGAIVPFSIPKWVGMKKGLATDVTDGAVIGTLNGVVATVGSGASLALNPDFLTNSNTSYLTRTVYNVVPYRLVTDPTTLEYAMFKGRTSLICSNSAAITNYGFGLLTAASGINSCGDTSQRAVAASTPTVTTQTGTNDAPNSEVDFAVTGFTSNGTAGAKVYVEATSSVDSTNSFYANESSPALIAAGSTDVTFSLPYSALPSGSWKLRLVIVPNLPGIANYRSGSDLLTKSGATTTVAATVSGKVNKFGTAVVTVSTASGTPTGNVSVYKGTSATGSPIATGTLTSGTVTITTLPKQKKKGNVPLFFVYSGAGDYSASSVAVTWKVK
jgi:hypothetical protein